MHLVGIAQSVGSVGLFLVVCAVTAGLLTLAMVALNRMEQATLPARIPTLPPTRPRTPSPLSAERVSSPGSVTFEPRK